MKIKITVPYGTAALEAWLPESLLQFVAEMEYLPGLADVDGAIVKSLDYPVGCPSLRRMVAGLKKILILIEDNTRNTPVQRILPLLLSYLKSAGIGRENCEIMIAGGTHRLMTEEEISGKVGREIYRQVRISQHDFHNMNEIVDLGTVKAGENLIPVQVNKKVLEADFVIGLGNIIPHSDAGFSGGAKILQPGVCGLATTSATHIAGALLPEIPLGDPENPCRLGMEESARRAGLDFIINIVQNYQNEIIEVVAGDFVAAHRRGCEVSKRSFGVKIPEPADIVIVGSYPCDMDWWQAEKALVAAYFAVRKGGCIIFASPCREGLVHNHPKLMEWLRLPFADAYRLAGQLDPGDADADLVAADVALANARVREKANILIVTDGLLDDEIKVLGYKKADSLQAAVDSALREQPDGRIGVIPRGGDCLPYW